MEVKNHILYDNGQPVAYKQTPNLSSGTKETWLKIKGEDYYEVSNLGRIRSLDRPNMYGKNTRMLKGKVLSPGLKNNGYQIVNLGRSNTNNHVHRLVATTFISNPENYRCVNHKNGIKTDNRVENLEWCDYSYNHYHGHRNITVYNDFLFDNETGIYFSSAKECWDCLKDTIKTSERTFRENVNPNGRRSKMKCSINMRKRFVRI